MAHQDDKVDVDVVGTKTLPNEPFLVSRERDLIWALKKTIQSPPLGPFQKHDINWLPHVTIRHGSYNHIEIAILKLRSFHGISSRIFSKGNKIILSSLANSQGQRNTKFVIPQTHWHTLEQVLQRLFTSALLSLMLSFF